MPLWAHNKTRTFRVCGTFFLYDYKVAEIKR